MKFQADLSVGTYPVGCIGNFNKSKWLPRYKKMGVWQRDRERVLFAESLSVRMKEFSVGAHIHSTLHVNTSVAWQRLASPFAKHILNSPSYSPRNCTYTYQTIYTQIQSLKITSPIVLNPSLLPMENVPLSPSPHKLLGDFLSLLVRGRWNLKFPLV